VSILNKLTFAKTSTLVVATIILSAWAGFVPWISFAIGDLGNWLLSTAALSGPYRFADKQLFNLLENIYRSWWDIGVQFFCVLTALQLLIIIPLGFYLSHVLYKRYRDGTARSWQFWVPMILLGLTVMFTLATLYTSYVEVRSWEGTSEQVDVVNDVAVPGDAFAA